LKWKTKILSAALALSLVVPAVALGTDAGTNTSNRPGKNCIPLEQRINPQQNQMNQDKLLEIVAQYTPESLSEWQNLLAEQEELAKKLRDKAPGKGRQGQLTNEQQEKIKAIQEEVQNGSLTQEQAREELNKLCPNVPGRRINQKNNLTEEQQAKIKAIREQVQNGSLTQEQAREELSKLGLNQRPNQPGRRINPECSLTDAQKEKIKSIQEQVRNGQLTQEQAQTELSQLGIDAPGKHFRPENRQAGASNGIMKDLFEAVEANDETKIKELLPQLLTQMQEKTQALANRLSE
jgi:anti-sigma28 factor (negative regulator of flagellin synthesis)